MTTNSSQSRRNLMKALIMSPSAKLWRTATLSGSLAWLFAAPRVASAMAPGDGLIEDPTEKWHDILKEWVEYLATNIPDAMAGKPIPAPDFGNEDLGTLDELAEEILAHAKALEVPQYLVPFAPLAPFPQIGTTPIGRDRFRTEISERIAMLQNTTDEFSKRRGDRRHMSAMIQFCTLTSQQFHRLGNMLVRLPPLPLPYGQYFMNGLQLQNGGSTNGKVKEAGRIVAEKRDTLDERSRDRKEQVASVVAGLQNLLGQEREALALEVQRLREMAEALQEHEQRHAELKTQRLSAQEKLGAAIGKVQQLSGEVETARIASEKAQNRVIKTRNKINELAERVSKGTSAFRCSAGYEWNVCNSHGLEKDLFLGGLNQASEELEKLRDRLPGYENIWNAAYNQHSQLTNRLASARVERQQADNEFNAIEPRYQNDLTALQTERETLQREKVKSRAEQHQNANMREAGQLQAIIERISHAND